MAEPKTPKTNKNGTHVWVKYGNAHAQLFRDLHFGRYNARTPATEIHADPDREYQKYNKQTITRKVKEIRKEVETYQQFQTGLDNQAFADLVKIHNPPPEEGRTSRGTCQGRRKRRR
eukprot:scaffold4412_cov91-Cylindrotheca_fusiformis.AAC.8